MKIKIVKEYDGKWMVWNKSNGKVADIVRIQEFGILGSSKPRYRVDVSGKTVESLIPNFKSAEKVARSFVA